MITEQQVNDYIATQFYTPETAHQARIDIKWAIEQMQAENEKLRAENNELRMTLKLTLPGRAAVEATQAENERLRGELSEILRIAERGDVNVQPLLTPIIEKAKNALK